MTSEDKFYTDIIEEEKAIVVGDKEDEDWFCVPTHRDWKIQQKSISELIEKLNQYHFRNKQQQQLIEKLAKKNEELQSKLYEEDFFEVEEAGEYIADNRTFKNGLCVFNNRLGMAYSVTEIVEVLNHMTKVIHEFESMKDGKYEVVDNDYITYIRDATLTEDKHEGAITDVYQLCSLINTLINENQELKKQIKVI